MSRLAGRVLRADQPVMVSAERVVRAGPETAARLGMPVGSVVHRQELRRYRSRVRQLLWRLRGGGSSVEAVL